MCPSHEEVDCCEYVGTSSQPKACQPISVADDDPFYSTLNPPVTCLDFKRSRPFDCDNGEGEGVKTDANGY